MANPKQLYMYTSYSESMDTDSHKHNFDTAALKEDQYESLYFFAEFSQIGKGRRYFNESETKPQQSRILKPSPSDKTNNSDVTYIGGKKHDMFYWNSIQQRNKPDLWTGLKQFLMKNKMPNVKISIGEAVFECHMIVLEYYSKFFRNFANVEIIELPEPEISTTGFVMAYDWMLADKPILQPGGVLQLLRAALFLRIEDLEKQCWNCLDNDLSLRESVGFRFYQQSKIYQMDGLRDLFLTRVCKYFLPLVASNAYLMLDLDEICALLHSSAIGINTEAEVLMSAVRWIDHDWKKREYSIDKLMKCVRFSLMPSWYLVAMQQQTLTCSKTIPIVSRPSVMATITQSINYTTTVESRRLDSNDFVEFLSACSLTLPIERQWILDNNCDYHHHLQCPNMDYLNYSMFENYIQKFNKDKDFDWTKLPFASLCEDDEDVVCPNSKCIAGIKKNLDQSIHLRQWDTLNSKLSDAVPAPLNEPAKQIQSVKSNKMATTNINKEPADAQFKEPTPDKNKFELIQTETSNSQSEKNKKNKTDSKSSNKKTLKTENTKEVSVQTEVKDDKRTQTEESNSDKSEKNSSKCSIEAQHKGSNGKDGSCRERHKKMSYVRGSFRPRHKCACKNHWRLSRPHKITPDEIQVQNETFQYPQYVAPNSHSLLYPDEYVPQSVYNGFPNVPEYAYNSYYMRHPGMVPSQDPNTNSMLLWNPQLQRNLAEGYPALRHNVFSGALYNGCPPELYMTELMNEQMVQNPDNSTSEQPAQDKYPNKEAPKTSDKVMNLQKDHRSPPQKSNMGQSKTTDKEKSKGFDHSSKHLPGYVNIIENQSAIVREKPVKQHVVRAIVDYSDTDTVSDTENTATDKQSENDQLTKKIPKKLTFMEQYQAFEKYQEQQHQKQSKNENKNCTKSSPNKLEMQDLLANFYNKQEPKIVPKGIPRKGHQEEEIPTSQKNVQPNISSSKKVQLQQGKEYYEKSYQDERPISRGIKSPEVKQRTHSPSKYGQSKTARPRKPQKPTDSQEDTETEATSTYENLLADLLPLKRELPQGQNTKSNIKQDLQKLQKCIFEGAVSGKVGCTNIDAKCHTIPYDAQEYYNKRHVSKATSSYDVSVPPSFLKGALGVENSTFRMAISPPSSMTSLISETSNTGTITPQSQKSGINEVASDKCTSLRERDMGPGLPVKISIIRNRIDAETVTDFTVVATQDSSVSTTETEDEQNSTSSEQTQLTILKHPTNIQTESEIAFDMPKSATLSRPHTLENKSENSDTRKESDRAENCLRKSTTLVDKMKIGNRTIYIFGGNDPHYPLGVLENNPKYQYDSTSQNSSASSKFGDNVMYYQSNFETWQHLTYIPFGMRHHYCAVKCNGKMYVIGGTKTVVGHEFEKIYEKTVWCYSPKTHEWIRECTLPEPRRDFAVVVMDVTTLKNKTSMFYHRFKGAVGFFVIGGEGVHGILNSVLFYDVIRKDWSKRASLNIPRYGLTATLIKDEIWVAGGLHHGSKPGDKLVVSTAVEIFSLLCKCTNCSECECDTNQNTKCKCEQWLSIRNRLRIPRAFARMCCVSEFEVYIIGGMTSENDSWTSTNEVDVFDFFKNAWYCCSNMCEERYCHDIALVDDGILIIGGISTLKNQTLKNVEFFDTKRRSCSKVLPSLPSRLSGLSVVCLDN